MNNLVSACPNATLLPPLTNHTCRLTPCRMPGWQIRVILQYLWLHILLERCTLQQTSPFFQGGQRLMALSSGSVSYLVSVSPKSGSHLVVASCRLFLTIDAGSWHRNKRCRTSLDRCRCSGARELSFPSGNVGRLRGGHTIVFFFWQDEGFIMAKVGNLSQVESNG